MSESLYAPTSSDLGEEKKNYVDRVIPLGKRVGRLRYFVLNLFLFSLYPLFFVVYLFYVTPWVSPVSPSKVVAIIGFAWLILLIGQIVLAFQRTMDVGGRAWWGLLFLIPGLNVLTIGLIFWQGSPGINIHGQKPQEKPVISIGVLGVAILFLFLSFTLTKLSI